jgi:hypothetical protein
MAKNFARHSWASVSSISSNTFLRLSYFSFRDDLAHRGSTTQTLGGSQEKLTSARRTTRQAAIDNACSPMPQPHWSKPMLTTTLLHANN